MSWTLRLRALLALPLLLASVLFAVDLAGAQAPGRSNGKMVFESNRDGNYEIYSMNPDGSHELRLTKNDVDDYGPVWSPDGSKVAFTSERDGNGEIYVMNADGSGQTRLTNEPAWDYEPYWSPDGTKILFETERHRSSCPPPPPPENESWRCNEIYAMNADGSGVTRLTSNLAGDYDQSWSPDGSKILFESERDGNFEIYMMNSDGTGQTNLSQNTADDYDGRWSPDGSKIVFTTYRTGNSEIYVMDADGTDQTNVTNNPTADYLADCCFPRPSWSPDGTKIVFGSDRSAGDEIYVINADGTNVVRLTNNDDDDWDPVWSPDGTRIAFESSRHGNPELYTMDPDGTNVTRMTSNDGEDWDPDWGVSQPSPETKITAKPKSKTGSKKAAFRFRATIPGATFECRLDSGAFELCESPKTYSSLKAGKHTFQVRAAVGSAVDPTSAKASWKITN